MKVGVKLEAKWTENICDHVTKGNVYKVIEANKAGFRIINDKGEKCFPVATTFTIVGDSNA
ncbi:MAG: hypothetical protein ACI35O_10305 [Bacillaceae bacterium]